MTVDELIEFNPILANALLWAEESCEDRLLHIVSREKVAFYVKSGMSPDAIYAFIKTGVLFNEQDTQHYSVNEIQECINAGMEYLELIRSKVN